MLFDDYFQLKGYQAASYMNKYTLQFSDHDLEKSYLHHKRVRMQLPVFWTISIAGQIILVVNLIITLVTGSSYLLIQKSSVVIFLLVTTVIIRWKPHLCNLALISINLILISLEVEMKEQFEPYDSFLYGSNQMIIHMVLLIVTEFKAAIITNFLLTGATLLLLALESGPVENTQILYTVIVRLCLCLILHFAEKFQREYHLLMVKEDSWDSLLAMVLKKPYVIFTFDRLSCQIKEINTRLGQGLPSFPELLQECRIGQATLKSKILQLLNQDSENEFRVSLREQRLSMTLYKCQFDVLTYILTVDSEEVHLKRQQKAHEQQLSKLQDRLSMQTQKIGKLVGAFLRRRDVRAMVDLRLSLLKSSLLQNQRKFKLKTLNLALVYSRVIEQFRHYKYQIEFQSIKSADLCETIPEYNLLFLLEILRCMDRRIKYKICLFQMTGRTRVTISGVFRQPSSSAFEFCRSILVKEEIRTTNSVTYLFKKTPCIPFRV